MSTTPSVWANGAPARPAVRWPQPAARCWKSVSDSQMLANFKLRIHPLAEPAIELQRLIVRRRQHYCCSARLLRHLAGKRGPGREAAWRLLRRDGRSAGRSRQSPPSTAIRNKSRANSTIAQAVDDCPLLPGHIHNAKPTSRFGSGRVLALNRQRHACTPAPRPRIPRCDDRTATSGAAV